MQIYRKWLEATALALWHSETRNEASNSQSLSLSVCLSVCLSLSLSLSLSLLYTNIAELQSVYQDELFFKFSEFFKFLKFVFTNLRIF